MTLNALRVAIVLVLGLFPAPILVAEAQQAGPVYCRGLLRNSLSPETFIGGFRQGLCELGYVEARTSASNTGWRVARTNFPTPQPSWSVATSM